MAGMRNENKKPMAKAGLSFKALEAKFRATGGKQSEIDQFLLELAKTIRSIGKRLNKDDLDYETQAYLRTRHAKNNR